jgi:hypothetical protein
VISFELLLTPSAASDSSGVVAHILCFGLSTLGRGGFFGEVESIIIWISVVIVICRIFSFEFCLHEYIAVVVVGFIEEIGFLLLLVLWLSFNCRRQNVSFYHNIEIFIIENGQSSQVERSVNNVKTRLAYSLAIQ